MVAFKQRRWSSSEEEALKAGINKYGEGKWSKILKDRKFGSILHLRSNVDLKDKWRNIILMKKAFARYRVRGALRNTRKIVKRRKRSLRTVVLSHPDVVAKPLTVLSGTSQVSEKMTNKFGSRRGVRSARRNTRKTMILGDMSLSTAVLSDPDIVVRKPLTVSSGTPEVSELDSIEIPMSRFRVLRAENWRPNNPIHILELMYMNMARLDNPMVDTISKAKEPHRSSQTTVATYLEKSQIAGVAGEYLDPPQELFEKGKRIEVLTREEGFSDSWYVATVIDLPSPMSHLKRKNSDSVAYLNKYYVEYEMLMDDDDTSCPLKEYVDAQLIRPICPFTSVSSFQVKDIVDAFYYDGWWIGVVTKALSNSRFEVTFGAPLGEHEFHISELRLHLDWVNGQWINPHTQKRAAEAHIIVGKEVEVSFEKDDYEVWFPATVLKDFGDDSYLVHYVCKKGREVSPKKATVCLPHIRPKPPQHKNKSFLLSDKVDAFNGCAWTSGLITKEFTDKKFVVSFKRKRTKVFSKLKLRRHMEWVDGRWIDASKSRETDNDASHLRPPKKFKTIDEAEIPTLTACETDTMNSKSSSKQHSSSIVCQNNAVVMKAPGNGQSSRKTENRSSSNKVIKEKKLGELDSDTPKIAKRRGRPPKIHKSSTNGNESNEGVRTAEEMKEKHCKTQGFTPNSSGLTRDETRSLRDDIPCQSSPERSQTVIRNQIGQGNVPERLIIEENMENSLSRGMSPELLETMNRMEIPTEPNEKAKRVALSEKMVKHYLRNGGKRSVDPSTESPYSIVYGNVSNAGLRTSEGTEEKACETEDIAPILIDLTGSPQDNIPCQSPPEGSRRVIGDQNSQGNVPARLVIEERAENTLSKQRGMSPELLELRIRKELPRHGEDVSEQVFGYLPNTYPPSSASLGLKCLLWDCTRPAQGFDYCSSHHAALALKEGTPGMNPVLRPGGTGVKECLLLTVLNAKAQGKDVGIPECERAAIAKSPWNAPELFDLNVLEGETIREWLFFDKPRRAFKKGRKKQLSLPDYNGRGWHESRKQVMNDFGAQKKSYYMDPQPSKDFEWHLYEYEIFNMDACALYRLEFKRVGSKKSRKGRSTNDSVADLQKQIEKSSELLEPRSRMEIPTDGVRIAEGTEEKDCDMEDIAPILNGLTNNGKRSLQDNIPSQSPPERSQTFISNQRGQGNVSARLLIEESMENSLSKQKGIAPEVLEPRSSMVIRTESEVAKHVLLYDKMVKRYLRNGGKRSADPSTESPRSIVYGNVSNAGVRTSRGTEEKACETEDIVPILIDLTGSPRDNIPCQSPPEESQTVICDRNGQGTVPASLAIEERVNSLSKQRSTSPELLEQWSRMEIPTESSEMAECVVSSDKMWKNYLSTGGKRNVDSSTESPHFIVDGIRTVEGREEKNCETEELAPILIRLTCDGTKSPQPNSICQSPPERSHTLIPYQTGEGNAQARLNIEESTENSLTKQIGTSPELLEPRSMMEIPTESIEKAKCVVSSNKLIKTYIRKRRKRSANLSTESPHSFLDGASSKETEVHNAPANNTPGIDFDVNQLLPFKKTLPLWDSIESMEVFQLFPQKPHFRALENSDEYCREGLALGQMVTFSKIVKTINEMQADMPRSAMEKCLENLIVLEDNGFDVKSIRDRLKNIELESRIMEFKEKKRKIVEDVDEIEKKLKELQAKREATMLKMKMRDAAIEASPSLLNNISDRLKSIPFDFDEMAAAPW